MSGQPSNGEQVATETATVNADESSRGSPGAGESRTGEAPGGYSYTRTLFKDDNQKIVVEHWLVHGAVHAWFGGDPRGSFTDPQRTRCDQRDDAILPRAHTRVNAK